MITSDQQHRIKYFPSFVHKRCDVKTLLKDRYGHALRIRFGTLRGYPNNSWETVRFCLGTGTYPLQIIQTPYNSYEGIVD